jgi:DNA polymerase-3 subunit alpha
MEIVGFEHLHLHTDFSLLDGYGMVEEYASHWKGHGDYLCISDHGMMAAIPRQIKACEASGKKDDPHKHKKLNPIFACELYVNPLQCEYTTDSELQSYIKSLDPQQLKVMRHRGYHLLAIAYNSTGYSNLVRLSSWGWTKGFYYRPRVNHEQLVKYREGIIFTSCCYASEIGRAFDSGGEEAGNAMIEKYISMFGKENFYLELMLLDFTKQKPYDQFIIRAADKYGLKLIVTNDCHYCKAEDSQYQRLMLMVQTQNTIQDIQHKIAEEGLQDFFELQDSNLWMKTEEELNEKWSKDYHDAIPYELFKQAKMNTVEICRRAKGVQLDRSIKLPQIPFANEKLKELVLQGFKERGLPMTKKYLDRVKEEYSLICHKEFSSYFLIQKQMTDEARRVCRELLGWGDGSEAVGPGRGSAVGSLVCYCLGITDVDPIRHDLLFKRFLSEARGGRSIKLRFSIDPLPSEPLAA